MSSATATDTLGARQTRNRKIASQITSTLTEQGQKQWRVKYCNWDDCSREDGSCWGNNISDAFQRVIVDGVETDIFIVGGDNMNGRRVVMEMRDLIGVLCGADGSKPRLKEEDGTEVTLAYILKNAGKCFAHEGIKEDTNLLLAEDEKCQFTVQVSFIECAKDGEAQTVLRKRNYQARAGEARNATLFINAQGCAFDTDAVSLGEMQSYMTKAVVDGPNGKENHRFYTATNHSNRSIKESGTETAEEAQAAVLAGYSCEVPMGPRGCKKIAACMDIQRPVKQKPCQPAYSGAGMMVAGAMSTGGIPASWGSEGPIEYRSLGGSKSNGARVYRSLGDDMETVPEPEPPRAHPDTECASPDHKKVRKAPTDGISMGRCYRGKDAGIAPAIEQTDLEPDPNGGLTTVTMHIMLMVEPGFVPTEEHIKDAIALAESYYTAARATGKGGVECDLFSVPSKAAGAVANLTPTAAVAIAETVKAVAPKVMVPVF